MTRNKAMLKSPMRTLTSYCSSFCTSHCQKAFSFCGPNLLFAKWLWTWMTMTLWVFPKNPTLLSVVILATMHLEYA